MIQLSKDRLFDVSYYPVEEKRREGTIEKMQKWHDGRFVWNNYEQFGYEYLTWCIELCAELDYQTEVDLLDEALTKKALPYELTVILSSENLKERFIKRIEALSSDSDAGVVYLSLIRDSNKNWLKTIVHTTYESDIPGDVYDYGESDSEYDTLLILSYDGENLLLNLGYDNVDFSELPTQAQRAISFLTWEII